MSSLARRAVRWAATLLGVKVLVAILLEYRFYFPPDFDRAVFLIGRKEIFVGIYPLAFYTHLVAGPLALMLAFVAIQTAAWRHPTMRRWHRYLGTVLLGVVVFFLAPSGLVMSRFSSSGAIAGLGLATLAGLSVAACVIAANLARQGRLAGHRVWAVRLFLLLAAPLLLRVASGLLIVLGWDNSTWYAAICWLSWLAPLMVYECSRRIANRVTANSLSV